MNNERNNQGSDLQFKHFILLSHNFQQTIIHIHNVDTITEIEKMLHEKCDKKEKTQI